MIVASTMPQPHIQPTYGPKALVDQVNDAPQSGLSEFSSRYAYAVRNIGMNPAMKIAGIFNPTAATISPMLAVSVYPGATQEIPRIAPEKVPTRPVARPLSSRPP